MQAPGQADETLAVGVSRGVNKGFFGVHNIRSTPLRYTYRRGVYGIGLDRGLMKTDRKTCQQDILTRIADIVVGAPYVTRNGAVRRS